MGKKEQCSSIADRSGDRCKKRASRFSRYCWHHYPKLPSWGALVLGFLAGVLVLPVEEVMARVWPDPMLEDLHSGLASLDAPLVPVHFVLDVKVQGDVQEDASIPLQPKAMMEWFRPTRVGGLDNFLVANSDSWYAILSRVDDQPVYRLNFLLHPKCTAAKESVRALLTTKRISIKDWLSPGTVVEGGSLSIIRMGAEPARLPIDAQVIASDGILELSTFTGLSTALDGTRQEP